MSNALRDMLINEIILPQIVASNQTYLGMIVKYDGAKQTADIVIESGESKDEDTVRDVPISKEFKSIYGEDPKVGTAVLMTYYSGDRALPLVTSIFRKEETNETGRESSQPAIE